ncbi:MAG: hypothetical protein Q4D38_05155 [Planctomycetia bacterium]|nr:hypothetical protein [Planctomycetia bacterium]
MFKKLSFGVLSLCLPLITFAQEATEPFDGTISIDSSLSSIDFGSVISDIGSMAATAMISALSLAAGIWGVLFIWRKVRSSAG